MDRLSHLDRFYSILEVVKDRLNGPHTLEPCHGRMMWPKRGVYFFFEPGQFCSDETNRLRVVRVGTHGLKAGSRSTLWNRLSQHRGTGSGGGNHRGSIFRLLVGESIMRCGLFEEAVSWGISSDASKAANLVSQSRKQVLDCEYALELAVSRHIRSMPFLWIRIDDEPGPRSYRGYIERNCIALLSNFSKAPRHEPSSAWLGLKCGRERVCASGLWNNNHIDANYDPEFLPHLERFVGLTDPV
jgi:hypothetical protein